MVLVCILVKYVPAVWAAAKDKDAQSVASFKNFFALQVYELRNQLRAAKACHYEQSEAILTSEETIRRFRGWVRIKYSLSISSA